MSSLFEFLFSKKGSTTTTTEKPTQASIADFIKEHTVEMPGSSKMIMIPVDEFEEMVRQAEAEEPQETVIDHVEVTIEEPEPEQKPVTPQPEETPEEVKPATEKPDDEIPAAETPEQPVSEDGSVVLSRLEEVKTLLERDNYKDSIIKDLHKEMERLNGNFFEDIRRPMIKSIIAIHRRMTGRVKALAKNPMRTDSDYEKLYDDMKFDLTTIADILEDEYDLEFYEPAAGDLYNPKEDNAVRVIAADSEQQDGLIAEVLYGGFKNASTDRIFLKANVIVYKYKKQ